MKMRKNKIPRTSFSQNWNQAVVMLTIFVLSVTQFNSISCLKTLYHHLLSQKHHIIIIIYPTVRESQARLVTGKMKVGKMSPVLSSCQLVPSIAVAN